MQKLLDFSVFESIMWAAVSWMAMNVSPIYPYIMAVFLFVVCDQVTGTMAAKKRNEPRTARRLQVSVEKLILYLIAILLSEVTVRVFLGDFPLPFTWATSIVIIRAEFKSNSNNIKEVTGVDLWPSIKLLLDKISSSKK